MNEYKKRTSLVFKALQVMAVVCVTFVILEIALRKMGVKPYEHFDNTEIEYFVKKYGFFIKNNSEIGFMPREGKFQIPLSKDSIFSATILADGSRYCGSKDDSGNKKIILITGDSNVFGIGLSDTDQVGYKLQTDMPNYHIINRAIPGSGDGSQYLVFKNSLNYYTPEILIGVYGSYHNIRNVLGRSIKKNMVIPEAKRQVFEFPVGEISGDSLQISFVKYQYTPIPLSNYFAVFEAFNLILEYIEYRYKKADRVTEKIWEKYIALSQRANAKLCVIVFGEDKVTKRTEALFETQHIRMIHINIPPSLTLSDGHANKEGHTYMTKIIMDSLKTWHWID